MIQVLQPTSHAGSRRISAIDSPLVLFSFLPWRRGKSVGKFFLSFLCVSGLPACTNSDEPVGYHALEGYVGRHQVGADADQWIEMLNGSGQWERTGLIFGYLDDRGECLKAVAGLKRENYAREYRCSPANVRTGTEG